MSNPGPFVADLIAYTNQKTVPNIFIDGKKNSQSISNC